MSNNISILLHKSIFLFLLVASPLLFSQTLNFKDLLKIFNTEHVSIVDDFLISKGYVYIGTEKNNSYSNQQWQFEDNKKDNIWYVMRILKNDEIKWITYAINDQKIVLSLKNEVKNLGFEFIDSKEESGKIMSYYLSKECKVLFQTGNENGKTVSQISILKLDQKTNFFDD